MSSMFLIWNHDPPDSNNIVLCAGPKEREALASWLLYRTPVRRCADFINELHAALQEQTKYIDALNKALGINILRAEDADVSFDKHLSHMCQEDVDKVLRHLQALFMCKSYTGVKEFDNHSISEEKRDNIFKNIIVPWFDWVRSAGQDESANAVSVNSVHYKYIEQHEIDSVANKFDTTKADINTTNNNKANTITNNSNLSNNNIINMNMNNNTTSNMLESITSTFTNMLGKLEPDMVRMTFDGNAAVKTTNGYKTYDVAKKKAVNMDSLVIPDMAAFLLLPSTKVNSGDIILRDGTFYSIISVDDSMNELVGYNYESGKKETLIRETHCFLGNTYFYSKLISPILSFFGGKTKPGDKKENESTGTEVSEDTMSMLLPLAMMAQNGDMNSILPMLLMSKLKGKEESSGMLRMLTLSNMMKGSNSNMNSILPLMLLSDNFPAI